MTWLRRYRARRLRDRAASQAQAYHRRYHRNDGDAAHFTYCDRWPCPHRACHVVQLNEETWR